jgi:hypothetical protein
VIWWQQLWRSLVLCLAAPYWCSLPMDHPYTADSESDARDVMLHWHGSQDRLVFTAHLSFEAYSAELASFPSFSWELVVVLCW